MSNLHRPAERLFLLDNLRTFLIFLVVLYHAGIVYESSGFFASFWIVDDPSTSDLPGLVNLVIDIFIMATIFFISGYFTPSSLERSGDWPFLKAKFRRLIVPWGLAVATLMPLYKVVFLYSRGLPQERWTTYFHFSNGGLSMSWLWFLPVLFAFYCVYVVLSRLCTPTDRLTVNRAVAAVFVIGFAYSSVISAFGWTGWTNTPLVDFQNERLLIYFLYFLLGSLCYRLKTLESASRSKKLFVAVNATAWIPVATYVVVVINLFLRPGQFLLSERADVLLLWLSFHLSLLSLVYCAVMTFRHYFNNQGRLARALGGLSYRVYLIHMIVMAPPALVLLNVEIPAILKYVILVVTTYAASNLVAWCYGWIASRARQTRERTDRLEAPASS